MAATAKPPTSRADTLERLARPRSAPKQLVRWIAAVRPTTLRAAIWARRACRAAHDAPSGLTVPPLPGVPRLPDAAYAGVEHALWLRGEQCLVRSYVRQAWFAAHGAPQEIVIGSRGGSGDFAAHAWLSGDSPGASEGYVELVRLPGPA